jgi:hypothetical protein
MKENLLYNAKGGVEKWPTLVHVCRRWRSVVFGSPHRLDLQFVCTPRTPSRDTLDVWPALPLIIEGTINVSSDVDNIVPSAVDNIVAALRHSNRVCQVHLSFWMTSCEPFENVLAAMQVPFPELTKLRLWLHDSDDTPPVIPNSFLGGSAPRLRVFHLYGIPFPGLPRLLLSATHLVELCHRCIPRSGFFSPEAMATLLSVLSSLEELSLEFEYPQSRPNLEGRRPPPLKRSVIPSLTRFGFKGVMGYLEDLVTCIDAPQLRGLCITFFNQIDFDTPRLAQFINCTPKFRAPKEARVQFDEIAVDVLVYGTHESGYATSLIVIPCRKQGRQLSSIGQVCNSPLPPLSMVEDLYIEHQYS